MIPEQPICHDLYCGLGGWAEGFLAEDYVCIGYDIERHDYGSGGYPGLLVLQDILAMHGSECRNAAVIVASPPCQEPSYRAMPWKRAKALNTAGPPHKFIALFEACFRIQREASEAAGRYIPLIVENVVGAQRWVERARWHHKSYFLWGDVPAIMPYAGREGIKQGGDWFADDGNPYISRLSWSTSRARKKAQAEVAKIPIELSRYLARCFKPTSLHVVEPRNAILA